MNKNLLWRARGTEMANVIAKWQTELRHRYDEDD
jgi:hypothetical protein